MYARSLFLTPLFLLVIHYNTFAQFINGKPLETLAARDAQQEAEYMADMASASLFDSPAQQQIRPATVTVHELSHSVPGKAKKEYKKAEKERRKGNRLAAIEHLKKAIAIDPEFWEAANDLGADYLEIDNLKGAVDQFNLGISIDPNNPISYLNLALAYLREIRNRDAERAVREDLRRNPADLRGRLILGIALTFQAKFTPEAEQNLKKAAPNFPQARLPLAAVLAANGATDEARSELRQYMASGPPAGVKLANSWLRVLDRASQDGTPVQVRVSK